MAFPVIEGTAESATTAAGTSHVVNLPSSIQAGDLLVVFMAKGGSAAVTINALTGWTELLDENQTFGTYVAYRYADGTEGASITLTSSGSNRTASIVYRISGAIDPATQAPEVSSVATGTSDAPDPGTCTPTGGAKDYLWLTFFTNGSGEEADDDTWLNNAATNYSNALQKTSGTGGTNVGAILGVSSRTNNAASENAVWPSGSTDVSRAWRAYTMAVHPAPPPTSTGVARISLPSAGSPSADTNHTLYARARKQSGTGVVTLKMALYEGSNNRSGDLTSSALTTSLAEYAFPISEANAANITDYSNLEIRFWGYSTSGDTVTVEVADIWFDLPESVSGDIIINVTAGSLTLSAAAPVVAERVEVTPASMTMSAPNSLLAHVAANFTGSMTLNAAAPTAVMWMSSSVGSMTLSSPAPIVAQVVVTPTASLTLSGPAPTVAEVAVASAANLILSAASPVVAEVAVGTPGSMTLSAPAATLVMIVSAPSALLTLSAADPTIFSGNNIIITTTPGSMTLDAATPTLAWIPVSSPGSMTLSAGSPTVAWAAVNFVGTMTLGAADSTLRMVMTVTPGSMTLSGPAPIVAFRVAPPAALLTLSAANPTIIVPITVTIVGAGTMYLSAAPPLIVIAGLVLTPWTEVALVLVGFSEGSLGLTTRTPGSLSASGYTEGGLTLTPRPVPPI